MLLSAVLGVTFGLKSQALATELCYNVDACSPNNLCQLQMGVYVSIVPARKKLWQSGPITVVTCVRLVYDGPNCTGETYFSNYTQNACNEVMPPQDPPGPGVPCGQ